MCHNLHYMLDRRSCTFRDGTTRVRTKGLTLTTTDMAGLSWTRPPATWGCQLSCDGLSFFFVSKGEAWLKLGDAPLKLSQGDLVLILRPLDSQLTSPQDAEAIPDEEFCFLMALQKERHRDEFFSGWCHRDMLELPLDLQGLPPVLYISRERMDSGLRGILRLLAAEIGHFEVGGDLFVRRLFETLILFCIRAWVGDSSMDLSRWFSALKDHSLSKVLAKMHTEPGAYWTIDELAGVASLSRATFARRFKQHMGVSPLAYLRQWRMGVAARLLIDTEASLAEVAKRVGYESEFALSHAFKRSQGLAPAGFRRLRRARQKPSYEMRSDEPSGAREPREDPFESSSAAVDRRRPPDELDSRIDVTSLASRGSILGEPRRPPRRAASGA